MATDMKPLQEDLLLDYLKHLSHYRQGRRAVHLTLCRLTRLTRQPITLQQTARIMRGLITGDTGRLFPLRNQDLVVIFQNQSEEEIERRIMRVRMLMRDDANLNEAEEEDRDILAVRYDLEHEFDRFAEAMTRLVADIKAGLPTAAEIQAHSIGKTQAKRDPNKPKVDLADLAGPVDDGLTSQPIPLGPRREPAKPLRVLRNETATAADFNIGDLIKLETALQSIDIEPYLTHVPVVLIDTKKDARRIMHEKSVAMKRLMGKFLPEHPNSIDPWLAGKAREMASAKHLMSLKSVEMGHDMAVLLEANLASMIQGGALARLAKLLPAEVRARTALTFGMEDLQLDPARYLAVRHRAVQTGFITAISHVSQVGFAATDWTLLPAEFVSVRYSRRLEAILSGSEQRGLDRALKTVGPARAILSDCLLPQSIERGRALGFRLFQGPAANAYASAR
ncbi:MAG: hypothetical protein ACFB22_13690 [Rhodothalassiaceae bacterium]